MYFSIKKDCQLKQNYDKLVVSNPNADKQKRVDVKMPIEVKGETYLNAKEASSYLGVSRETLNNYVNAKRIKRYKQGIGRTAYYKQTELDRLLEMREDSDDQE
jgi:excisionase family DNA binding protein